MTRTHFTASAEAHPVELSDVADNMIPSPSDQEGLKGFPKEHGADSSDMDASDSPGFEPSAVKSPTDFSQLPLELRRQILKGCLPPGKIISIFYYHTIIQFGTPAPIGLRINRESRAETLRHYKILLPHTGSLEYWDSTVDTIQHGDMLIYMASTYVAMTLTVCPTPDIIKADLATCRFVEFFYPPGVRGLQVFVSMTKSWTKKDSSTSSVEIGPNLRSYYPNMKMIRLWPDCGPDQARDAHQGLIDLLSAYQQEPPDGWAIKDDRNSIEIQILDSTRERTWTWYLPVAN